MKFNRLVWNYSVGGGYRQGFGVTSMADDEVKAKMFYTEFKKTPNSMMEFQILYAQELQIIKKRKALLQQCRDEYSEWFKSTAKQTMPELFI